MEAGYRTQEVDEARSAMDRLQAELEQARVELERSKKLEPSGAIPLEQVQRDATRVQTLEADVEKARLRVELLEEGYRKEDVALALAQRQKAEAQRDLAALKLGYTTIRSPMSGVVLERLGHRGQWVTPRDGVIASLYDPSDLEVRVDVNQDDLPKVFVEQTVEITSRAEPQRQYAGRVFLIEPKADLVKNTVPVRVKIAPSENHLLHPDMVVAVRFLPRGTELSAAEAAERAGRGRPGPPRGRRARVGRPARGRGDVRLRPRGRQGASHARGSRRPRRGGVRRRTGPEGRRDGGHEGPGAGRRRRRGTRGRVAGVMG